MDIYWDLITYKKPKTYNCKGNIQVNFNNQLTFSKIQFYLPLPYKNP